MLDELEAWGAVPVALPVLGLCGWWAGRLVFPEGPMAQRVVAAVVLMQAFVQASVWALGAAGWLTGPALLTVLAVTALLLARADALYTSRPSTPAGPWWSWWPLLPGALLVLGLAVTARLLPVWQWDSLGYHLPFVNLVVQGRGFVGLPDDLRYITTYPHNIELWMVWLRVLLPDDRLVDLAQVPLGAAGAAITAAIARQAGAPRWASLLAGVWWLTVPVVFLQMPSNYVDVGVATALLAALFWVVLGPIDGRSVVLGGLSIGLFLGSKPSAPMAAAVLGAWLAVRALKAGATRPLGLAVVALLAFGAERYLVLLLEHGNPVWPVAVHLGPLHLPGTHQVHELLAAGAAVPAAEGPALVRVLISWLAIDAAPVFDMKLGGLGLVFLLALPLALWAVVRRRWWPLVGAAAIALLSPDPSFARYVLALPALIFAAAMVALPARARVGWAVLACAAAAWQVHHTVPGLTSEGPAWGTFWSLNDDARRTAMGPHGRPTDYPPTWSAVGAGESIVFDLDFEFPGLLWAPSLPYRVVPVRPGASREDVLAQLERERARFVAAGPRTAAWLGRTWRRAFACRSADCAVYERTSVAADTSTASRR